MNPFSPYKKYDSNLAEILSRINKTVSAEPLRELLEYLSQVDIEADMQMVVKTLSSKFESDCKPIVNKILYKALSRLKKHALHNKGGLLNKISLAGENTAPSMDIHVRTVEVPWIYHNFDSKDPYALKLFESFFDAKKVSKELEAYLKWNDPMRDLSCFLYIMNSSDDQHYFDVQKLEMCTYFEFDSLHKILKTIKKNFPIEIMKISKTNSVDSGVSEKKYVKMAKECFESVKNVRNTLFLNRKYRILLDIYDFIDDSIYYEARYLECEILKRVCNRGIEHRRLELANLDQIEVVLGKMDNDASMDDLYNFTLKNINKTMCLFQIIEKTGISTSFIQNNREKFAPLANQAIKMHFVTKICSCTAKASEYISDLKSVFTGKYQIVVAAVLNHKLGLDEAGSRTGGLESAYVKKDIEELMDYSVKVFPKSYFLENDFNASIVPLLKEYPSLLDDSLLSNGSQHNLKNLISNFKNTKIDDVVDVIEKLETLLLFFENFTQDEIHSIYKKRKNFPGNLKIVYLFYLRSLILAPSSNDKHIQSTNELLDHIDYRQIFNLFLDANFLQFLLVSRINLANFTECVLNYVREMNIPVSILYCGYNFDHDANVIKHLDLSSIPQKDPVLTIVHDVLEHVFFNKKDNTFNSYFPVAMNGQDSSLNEKADLFFIEILYNLIGIVLFGPICPHVKALKNYDNLIEKIPFLAHEPKGTTLRKVLEAKLDLGKNNFILERFFQEVFDPQQASIPKSILKLNKFKEIDMILRHVKFSPNYLLGINPSLLSLLALENVIDSLVLNLKDEKFKIITNLVVYDDLNEKNCTPPANNGGSAPESTFSDILVVKSKISDINLGGREIKLENYDFFELFKEQDAESILDFLYLIEDDDLLYLKDFRDERISVYWALVSLCASHLSKDFINLYSFSKLESNTLDDVVLDLILSPIIKYKRSFWTLLSATIHKTSNIYISMFFEKMITNEMDAQAEGYFSKNSIIPLHDYLVSCSKREFDLFCFVFPNVCFKVDLGGRKFELKEFIKEMLESKIGNGKLTFSETNEFYSLRLVYRVDSIDHVAMINIPISYPSKPARIEFDHKQAKNTKFYCKLNELIKKTSKFIEVFLLWKIDIDSHIAGYTECMICYYIMEPKYRTLPGFRCQNCSNVYHDKCVYKWVSESKNKQCPLCRVPLDV